MSSKTALFFVPDASSKGDPNLQQLIRGHAQRHIWGKKKQESIRRLENTSFASTPPPRYRPCHASEERHGSRQKKDACQTAHVRDIGSGNSDPFDMAVARVDPTLHAYLCYYATSMWCAGRRADRFLATYGALAIREEGLMHAIAASAAVRQQSCSRRATPALIQPCLTQHELLYGALTASNIRKRLDSEQDSASDLTIGLIAVMAMFEAVDLGRLDRSRLHLSAIRKIIGTRPSDDVISWMWYERVIIADVKTACVGLSRPLLPLLPTCRSTLSVQEILYCQVDNWVPFLDSGALVQFVTPPCLDIIHQVHELSLLVELSSGFEHFEYELSPGCSLFLYQRLALEQALLDLIADISEDATPLEACIHVGVLLFINTTFWVRFETTCVILESLCERLRRLWSSFSKQMTMPSITTFKVGTWLLFLGAYASKGTDNYAWFMNELAMPAGSHCCGACGTPSVLERSGIGAFNVLRRAGIPTIIDLPGVGREYQDHNAAVFPYKTNLAPHDTLDGILSNRVDIDHLVSTNDKILGWNGIDVASKIRPTEADVDALGPVFRKAWDRNFKDFPDKPMIITGLMSFFLGDQPAIPAGQYVTVLNITTYPYSRGHIHITGPHIMNPLDFDIGFFTDAGDIDLKQQVWAYKNQREIMRRTSMYRGELAMGHPRYPSGSPAACVEIDAPLGDVTDIKYSAKNNKAIEDWLRLKLARPWHSLGTARIASRDDFGVVDENLNVYGLQRLKVADMSVVPKNMGSNTNNAAMIIGGKAADIIIAELMLKR